MTKEEAKTGIGPYLHEQKVVLRVIRKAGMLTDKMFDGVFGDTITKTDSTGNTTIRRRRPKLRFLSAEGHAFFLGDMSSMGDWSKWLDLTQIMAVTGLIKITTIGTDDDKPTIAYILTDKGQQLALRKGGNA